MTTTALRPLDWRTAYEHMLTIRAFEEETWRMARAGVLGSKHLSGGQEAVPVGAMAALTQADRVVATYGATAGRSPAASRCARCWPRCATGPRAWSSPRRSACR